MDFKPCDVVEIIPLELTGIVTCSMLYTDGWKYEVRFWKDCETKFQIVLASELKKI